ncbi:MAG TPA: response regulator [Acidimicrobiales bacterium]|nr:response regulator [Acidimicrobiales bacterium]
MEPGAQISPATARDEAAGKHLPLRVVIAEDEAAIATLLTLSLESAGYVVTSTSDGEAALAKILETLPDVVLLDMMMPKMDGTEVVRRMKETPATSSIAIIMLTARSDDSDVWDGWASGVNYYLTKPFDLEAVVRCVGEVASMSRDAPISEEEDGR